MMINNILITGTTNGGIGLESAKELITRFNTIYKTNTLNIYLTIRSKSKQDIALKDIKQHCKITQNSINITFLQLDLSDLDNVGRFADEFNNIDNIQKYGLHALVNNAGIMMIPKYTLSKQNFELHFHVNYLAPWLLTKLLLPSLRIAAVAHHNTPEKPTIYPPRIINVSSDAHIWALKHFQIERDLPPTLSSQSDKYSHEKLYGISKLLQIYHTIALNKHLNRENIIAFSVHPGVIPQTGITRESGWMLRTFSLPALRIYSYFQPETPWAPKTIHEGGLTTVECVLTKEPLFVKEQDSTKFHNFWRDEKPALRVGKRLYDVELAENIWDVTGRLFGSDGTMTSRL